MKATLFAGAPRKPSRSRLRRFSSCQGSRIAMFIVLASFRHAKWIHVPYLGGRKMISRAWRDPHRNGHVAQVDVAGGALVKVVHAVAAGFYCIAETLAVAAQHLDARPHGFGNLRAQPQGPDGHT